jgi:RNA polymerase sigma-70 factor (ECF subfamily)
MNQKILRQGDFKLMHVEQVWHSFHEPLKKFILARIGNQAAAEDILQNVFLKIFTHLDELRHEHKMKSWVYQITRNAVIDYYRREKPTDQLPVELTETIE